MKRTRKLAYTIQDARRLAKLGLKPAQIAKRIDVDRSTVSRWISSGKLTIEEAKVRAVAIHASNTQTPADWAKSIREEFDLDVTDDQLVTLAEEQLALSRDVDCSVRERLAAGAEYLKTLRQLNLPGKAAAVAASAQPATTTAAPAKPRIVHSKKKPAVDPRAKYLAVVNQ